MTVRKTVLNSFALILFITSIFVSGVVLACDAAGKSTHMGLLMSVDATQKTFTIRDAQSQSPITFSANNEILTGLKEASGSIMVNYTEKDDGNLTAVGVTF